MAAQRGFFDLDERYAALSKAGDPPERLAGVIDFDLFRPELDATLDRSDGRQGGRAPMDPVLMFKVLVIQALYGLSDAQAEFQIMDRRSASTTASGRRTRRPSGGCGKPWCGPARWRNSSPGSTRILRTPDISPWAGRSSMPPSWRPRAGA